MNSPARARPAPVLAVLAACVLLSAHLGCGRTPQDVRPPSTGAPPSHAEPLTPPAPASTEPVTPEPAGNEDLALVAMSRRVARFVDRELDAYRQQLVHHGLIAAEFLELRLRAAPANASCPRKTLLAERVCEALAVELAGVQGVVLRGEEAAAGPDSMALGVAVVTNFEAAPPTAVQCAFELHLGESRRVYRDRFDSEALVLIRSPDAEGQPALVHVAKGDFVADFPATVGRWFTLPRGSYERITVRSEAGPWSPPLRLGLLNLWDLSTSSNAQAVVAKPPPPAPVPPPPVPLGRDVPRAAGETPRLEITAPADGATVPRRCAVKGRAVGLAGAWVEVTVIPLGDIEYPQDGRCFITSDDSSWQVAGCIFGRLQDSDQQFYVRARATRAGSRVDSQTIRVRRMSQN